jgi:rod shape-determining protein MreC
MDFLRRHRVLVSATALLLMSLFLVSISVRSRPYRDPLAEVVLFVFSPLQGAAQWVTRGVTNAWFGYVYLVGARAENEHLRDRVAALETDVVRLGELEQSNNRLTELLRFRREMRVEARGARVIARDPLHWFRSLVIDRGRQDGVREGLAVLAPGGVVGRVVEVGRAASRVMLLTDNDSGIAAVVQRSRAEGIVQGGRDQGCRMNYLRRDVDVVAGDRVVTSGLDGIFPKGIFIGTITEIALEHRDLLLSARVEPSVPLADLEEVMVVDPRQQDDEL